MIPQAPRIGPFKERLCESLTARDVTLSLANYLLGERQGMSARGDPRQNRPLLDSNLFRVNVS
jgi:hypothetical protein